MSELTRGPQAAVARVVLMTAPDLEIARRLARELVGARLAACANLVPGLTSVYRWEGAVQEDAEVLLVVKTTVERLPAVAELVARLHPYEVPELIALEPSAVADSYLHWMVAESRPAPEEPPA